MANTTYPASGMIKLEVGNLDNQVEYTIYLVSMSKYAE